MFPLSHVRSLLLVLSMVVAIASSDKGATLRATQEQSPDETLLRAAVSQYFESFAKKNQDDLLKYWSAGAPELETRRKEFQRDFAASDIKTGRPSTVFGKMVRAMKWVKESGVWKIAHEASAEDELAASLIAAKTDEERASIFAPDGELLNPEMIRALVARGNRLRTQGNFSEALRIYQIALM